MNFVKELILLASLWSDALGVTVYSRVAEVSKLSASAKNALNSFVGRIFANLRQKTLFFRVLPKMQQKGSFYLVLEKLFFLVFPSFT